MGSFGELLRAGEAIQQRAERKRGAQAAQLFAEAVAKYREALHAAATGQAPPADDYATALFNLAECLQQGADATLAACTALPDGQLSAAAAADADARAAAALQEAVAVYRRVQEGGQPRTDALVCAGNALSTWAEVAARGEPQRGVALLADACEAYRAALRREPGDAATLGNLADALVSAGSLCCEAGQGERGGALFAEAMQTYELACGASSSADGDDVPGLLLNWGRGLLAAAQAAREPGAALALLAEAEARLAAAADFQRGDAAPLLALGDVLLEAGERRGAGGDAAGAEAALRRALDEGYRAAQRLQAHCPEAAAGVGDACVQLARLAAAAGDGGAAGALWAEAEAAYGAALAAAPAFDWRERCELRFNRACCLARSGRGAEAAAELRALVAAGGTTAQEVAADADLAGLAL